MTLPSTSIEVPLSVSADQVWEWVADPGRLPRWWPDVDRVDRPGEATYVRWVTSPRGRAVPMRFELSSLEPGVCVTWSQAIIGTAFERAVKSATEEISLKSVDDGSLVRLTISRKLRGTAKLGSFFVRRGQKQQLALAAEGLSGEFS